MTTTRTRSRLTALLASLALAMIAMTGLSSAAQASEASGGPTTDDVTASSHGCPRGAVCIYPDRGWNGGNPTYVFWSYGVHKIYNQYGTHRIFNNQYGGAVADLCGGGNGTQCDLSVTEGVTIMDITEINSLRLRMP